MRAKIIPTLYTFFIISIIYIVFTLVVNGGYIGVTKQAYYNYLLDAISHGRINILAPSSYDLSLFHGKWYMNWGPGALLFVLPFYLLYHTHASDVVYTLIAGLLNVFLFYVLIQECSTYFNLKISYLKKLFVLFCFAFASPNFYLSFGGMVWQTEQIVGIFYLLISYIFFFKFLNKGRYLFLLLSLIFFNIAWLSRYTLIFHGILFLFLIIRDGICQKKIVTRISVMTVIVCVFALGIEFLYNYLKFQNLFETGLGNHNASPRFHAIITTQKFFSLVYLPHNLYYYFFHWFSLLKNKPYLRIDQEGNSIFSVYPELLLLCLLYIKRKIFSKRIQEFLIVVGTIVGLSFLVYLTYFTTGWTQFGSRYFLDVTPILFICFLFIIDYIPLSLLSLFLLEGVIVNFWGTVLYYYNS